MVSLSPIPVLRTSQIIDNRKFKINFKKKKKEEGKKHGVVVHTCNRNTGEAKTRG
jgi:hypothetical protein